MARRRRYHPCGACARAADPMDPHYCGAEQATEGRESCDCEFRDVHLAVQPLAAPAEPRQHSSTATPEEIFAIDNQDDIG